MSKSAMRKYIFLLVFAVTVPVLFGFECMSWMICNDTSEEGGTIGPQQRSFLDDSDQRDLANILVIGDSVMAYYHSACSDTWDYYRSDGNYQEHEHCYKSIGDDISVELVDAHSWDDEDALVRTDARGGATLTQSINYDVLSIPSQYCRATRPGNPTVVPPILPATYDDTTGGCTQYDGPIKEFDWVIFDGGGNDLTKDCKNPPFWGYPTCTEYCAETMQNGINAMMGFLAYMINDGMPSERIILFANNRVHNDSAWGYYNPCIDYLDYAAGFIGYYMQINAILPQDWIDPAFLNTYQYDVSYYDAFDKIHPSHKTVDLVSQRIATIINENTP